MADAGDPVDPIELLARRRAGLADFLAEREPRVADFADAMDLPATPSMTVDPDAGLPALAAALTTQAIEPDDRMWLVAHLVYIIGDVFVQRLGATWLVGDVAGARTFGRYVVGQFTRIAAPGIVIDPFEIASHFVDQPPGRDLVALLQSVEAAARAAATPTV